MIGQLEEALGINSDDSVFDYRLYQDLINQQRVVDIRNEYNRVRTIPDSITQSIPCFEMEIVDATTCCGEVLSGCKILRSKVPLPIPIDFHQTDGILFIKPNKITSKPTIYVSIDRIPYISEDSLTANLLYSFIYNGYLYLYSKNSKYLLIDSVTIYGIFTDPFEAGKLGCHGEGCFDYSSEYPLSDWMWQTLTKPNVMANLMAKQFIKLDEDNNAKDDKTEQILNPKKSK